MGSGGVECNIYYHPKFGEGKQKKPLAAPEAAFLQRGSKTVDLVSSRPIADGHPALIIVLGVQL